MFHKILRVTLTVFAFAFSAAFFSVHAQDNSNSGSRPNAEQEDFPKGIKETLAKNRIDREKKDFEELLKRGDEAAQIGEELGKSFAQNNAITSEDKSKLERLEKISKKIREALGGSSDDQSADGKNDGFDSSKMSSLGEAVDKLKNVSAKLADELKKTSRYTISAAAIQSSNAVLKIVRFIRVGKN